MKIAVVSTYPPRPCGIGTFSADLRNALCQADQAAEVNVISIVNDSPVRESRKAGRASQSTSSALRNHPPEVSASLRQHVREDYTTIARMLNSDGTDVVLIEHEYGIFGGEAGEFVLTLVSQLTAPVVVTLHTVLSAPSPAQAATLRALCDHAAAVTVFTETARSMVIQADLVAPSRVRVVPHGAPPLVVARQLAPTADGAPVVTGPLTAVGDGLDRTMRRRLAGRTVLSTFGLISSGKGIEMAIDAVAQVIPRHPDVLYLVAGQTHPEVVKREGERYREQLEAQVARLGLADHVHFLDKFLDIDELAVLLSSTDLYLTPYRSREQIVSGALTFAIAAGCPVVSTPYFYAEDLLSAGAGVLVPFDDGPAMAAAITDLLDHPDRLAAARAAAERIGSELSWRSVGQVTLEVLAEAAGSDRTPRLDGVRLDQLLTLTDDVGIIQHADGVAPRLDSGYCVDDVARLVLVAHQLGDRLPGGRPMVRTGLAFLSHAWDGATGGLHNFMGYDRRWIDRAGIGDHVGRAVWALGEIVAADPTTGEGRPSLRQLERLSPLLLKLDSPRAVAHALLGLCRPEPDQLSPALLEIRHHLARRLTDTYDAHATPDWPWFEHYLTYDNARLAQAAIAAGVRMDDAALVKRGRVALDWYLIQCGVAQGHLQLIGNTWLRREETRDAVAGGDEQPLDAAAIVEAAVEAYLVTEDEGYAAAARTAFAWFTGANRLGQPVYDAATGGCHDGLGPEALNDNEGAESTLAFWQSLLALERAHLATFTLAEK